MTAMTRKQFERLHPDFRLGKWNDSPRAVVLDKATGATVLAPVQVVEEPPACPECHGEGTVLVVVGEYRGWNNVVEPEEAEEPCGECGGSGVARCAYCGDESECEGPDGPACGLCQEEE